MFTQKNIKDLQYTVFGNRGSEKVFNSGKKFDQLIEL